MTLCSKLQIPLPEKGIIIRRKGKHQYIYKVTKTYRNQNKQPTNTRITIGKLDPKTNMLIPNNNYWKHYNNYTPTTTTNNNNHDPTTTTQTKQTTTPNQTLTYQSIHSIGSTFLIKKLYDNLKITNILTNTFGKKRATDILTAATYMTTQGNIFEHILNWSQTHLLHPTPPLTSPQASQLFNTITTQEQLTFFQAWIDQQPQPPKYLAYDVTSFSSYSTNITEVEWGYNRDKEKLPQINIGCYLDQQTKRPLFYVSYPGSIVDKSHLPYMMTYNKTLNVGSDTCHVMDRGFCSEANIVYMHNSKLQYIIGVEMDHKKVRAALREVQASKNLVSMRNRVKDDVYARLFSSSCFYGDVESNLHVYFDADLAARQRNDLYRRVESWEEELCQLEQLTRREAKRFRRYFKVDLAVDGSFRFERDYDRIDVFDGDCGFFGLLTNTCGSSVDVLSVYRQRDVLEKGFDDLKNYLDMKRLRVHGSGVLGGKLFCCFVSLVVVCEISRLLSEFLRVRSLSKVGLFLELDKIKVVVLSDGVCLVNPLSKVQRDILEGCGLTETDLKNYLKNQEP